MYISGGKDPFNCKLFPGTIRGVAIQWLATLPSRSIRSFNALPPLSIKQLEVVDLFDIKQAKGESLKSYLARINNATVRLSKKGLRVSQFNGALALRRPTSMGEIRTRVEKYIEAEEDKEDRVLAEEATSADG
ncbi:hypothetical protein CR513_17687, partial [Mucuna pruriens]